MTGVAPDALVDAHVHTLKSDGLATPMQIASLAKRSGVAVVAITDHDVLQDADELRFAGASAGVLLLGGIELSTTFGDRGLHLLGYGFDPTHPELIAACARRAEFRRQRWRQMVDRLRARRVQLDERRLAQLGAAPAPGRRHLARELIRLRQASSVRDAFDRYLRDADRQVTDDDPLTTSTAIDLLHRAGGKAALAHPPANLRASDWRALTDAGLDGVEVHFPRLAKSHRRFLEARRSEYRLCGLGGSDYHGDGSNDFVGACTIPGAQFAELVDFAALPCNNLPVPA